MVDLAVTGQLAQLRLVQLYVQYAMLHVFLKFTNFNLAAALQRRLEKLVAVPHSKNSLEPNKVGDTTKGYNKIQIQTARQEIVTVRAKSE